MADALPVCDVLCEATEYLSKLGSNLKVRTDNLREKKIRKNLLKNTHAVQKAANKVLLICELSKKSLENVETGVKHLLSQVAASQSAGTQTSRHLSDSKGPYEYFEYASEQLKIRKKISLAHYTSVKVVAKAMPPSMLEKYPVYIDCKLLRRNKKKIQKTKSSKDVQNTKSENSSKSATANISESDDIESLSIKPGNVCDGNVIPERDLEQNCESRIVHDLKSIKVTNENSNNQSDKLNKTTPKSVNNISVNVDLSADMCDKKEHSDIVNKRTDVESANGNEESNTAKKRKFSHIKTFSDSESENEKGKEKLEENNKSVNTNGDTAKLCLDNSLEVTCNNNESTKEKSANLDKDSDGATNEKEKKETSAESAKSSKFFIKCININKLLEVPKEDECVIINDDDEVSGSKHSPKKNVEKIKREIKNKPKRKSTNNQDLAKERYREQKRKEVKSFKPKEFSISLKKLPKFTAEFLKSYKINKIVKGRSVIFAIESCSERPIEECNSAKSLLQEFDKNSQKITNNQINLDKNQVNSTEPFDSDTNEDNVINRDLLQVTEHVKKALLDDSDSDTNNVLETSFSTHRKLIKNEENTATKTKKTNESLEKQQKTVENGNETNNENAQAQCDTDILINFETSKSPSQAKSLLLNNSSDDDPTIMKTTDSVANPKSPTDNVIKKKDKKSSRSSVDSEKIKSPLSQSSSNRKNCISPNLEADQEIIKSSLLNDSSNDSFASQNRDKNDKDVSPKPSDPERIKSLLLDDSSCNSSTPQKRESSHEKTSSHHSNDPEKIKMSLLNDSLDSDQSSPKKDSCQDTYNAEQLKTSLLNDSDASSSSQKTKKDNETSPKPLDKEQEVIKSSLLNDSDSPLKSQEGKSNETISPQKSKRKRIMDNMRAKKMLLTYSSSSDTEDEQLKNALKEIKDFLLEDTSDKNNKHRTGHYSESSSDKDLNLLSRREMNKSRKKKHSKEDTKSGKKRKVKQGMSDAENSKSSIRKMGGTRTKLGSSSSQSSDTQDVNDKVIDGLTNLKSLHKSRRRRTSEGSAGSASKPTDTDKYEMPKVPRIATENLLKAETSSDAASLADSEEALEEEVEELPTVSMSALNGDGVHLAKEDLLEDSDSSSSHNKSQEDEKNLEANDDQDEDENMKSRRRKALAISSDSEAGSSRRRERDRAHDKLSDFEDSDDDASEPQGKKKRKKKPADSDDNSSVESGKKKRRRIKNIDDTDDSDSDTENEGRNKHGRKNIRKVMGKNQLEEATKKAAREEKERIARIAERQKLVSWFSACGCRGGALATARGSVAALLRSQAFALVSPRAISAYRARPSSENGRVGAQYERAAARPGTPLRLAGVFADGSKAKAPKYAQLIDPQGNELFVPINTKGELYEVCPEELSPAEWEAVPGGAGSAPPDAAARAHRLPHLLSLWPLPARVRLLAGTVPIEMAHDVGEDLLLRAAITEPVLVMCSLPDSGPTSPSRPVETRHPPREALQLLPLHGNLRVRRTQLGFDTEKRMFLSTRLQKALTFCQLNVDNWIRQISYANSTVVSKAKTAEDLIKDHEPVKFEKEKKFTLQGLKIDPSRLFGKSEKVLKDIPDETEGSIIFLSKNELEHMNYDVYSEDEGKEEKSDDKGDGEQFTNDKMHVFREDSAQKKSKWFKNLKLLKSTDKLDDKITAIENNDKNRDVKDPFDPLGEKHSSIERYQDMAKLIEDRFGASRKSDGTAEKSHSYKSLTTSSSEMGTSQCSSNHKKPVLTKSVSVQTGMPDSPTEEDSGINIHGRKNLSVDQINYCGSMESNSSSGRKLKSLDENMLKKSSATKSSTNLERRQRIQPDLIPEKVIAKSESYNQIQSCEDINMFGAGSMYNDNDFEINYKQHSFITEKLCSEFHVKTKRVLSKSTSNLLHPKKPNDKKEASNSNSMPTKTERSNDGEKLNFRKKIDKPRAPTPKPELDEDIALDISEEPQRQVKIRRSISSIQKRKLPVIEDLPYGQVADAVDDEEEKIDSDSSSDNIYAEICTPNSNKPPEDNYDSSIDILATDPVICNVKKEINIRNDERAKQIENQDNSFRHIEVVVIEKTTDFELDNSSLASSEFDDGGSKNDVSITIDSWEREKTSSHSDPKNHAIRLEVTSNMEDYSIENNIEINEVRLVKDNSLCFSNSIHLNGTYPNEAIYDTLK